MKMTWKTKTKENENEGRGTLSFIKKSKALMSQRVQGTFPIKHLIGKPLQSNTFSHTHCKQRMIYPTTDSESSSPSFFPGAIFK